MDYRPLANTSLNVSRLCLGTMTWGEQNNKAEAFQQLDYATSLGVNFIDTAELYPVPPKANTYTTTEKILGKWLTLHKHRNDLIIATKAAGPGDWVSYINETGPTLKRSDIMRAVEGSLKRLNTDYIDLYQIHWPARSTNFFGQLGYQFAEDKPNIASIEETLSSLNELVKSGKVRYIGVSNETPWGVSQYLQLADKHDWPKLVSIQNPYNLLNRTYEIGLAEFAQREHVGLLAYSPLAFGVLSGKYLYGAKPAGARLTLFSRFSRYTNPYAQKATEAYVQLAEQYGLDPAQMALAFVSSRPFTTSTIMGTTTIEQLKTDIASWDVTLNDEVLNAIERIHQQYSNPAP
ncbi:NADP(H)-dependent aldo-keto reductase [Zooshikella harenae]|uniref:NADP(H)-dependent aldo-keto reductase n=1 Tax=Zooshikella harenae TaxID=2827238 RepID=A0ABS5ZA60_9GAMM|nr:NADP(H)-dependent aldo-keto reductase [Zooshikella harenae]MBU2710206.1 NADP(H)-dependent aldo-keto reductase [Zooshikella harenae]